MSSQVFASFLASSEDSIQHAQHIQQFYEMATMISKEQIELYLPKIEAMVNTAVNNAMSNALSRAVSATEIDVNRIVDITVKDMNAQFHSEEVSKFVADNLRATLTDALKNIDLNLIIS